MINAWLIDNFGQRLIIFQKISSHCNCHSVTTLRQQFQGHNIKVSWCCSVIILESLFLFAWKNGHQCQRQNCLNVAKILLIIFQTNYSILFFSQEKKMGQGHYHLRRICTLHKVSWIWRWKRNFHELHLCKGT